MFRFGFNFRVSLSLSLSQKFSIELVWCSRMLCLAVSHPLACTGPNDLPNIFLSNFFGLKIFTKIFQTNTLFDPTIPRDPTISQTHGHKNSHLAKFEISLWTPSKKKTAKRVTLSLLPLTPPPPSLRVTSLKSDKVCFRRPPPLQERVTSLVTFGGFQENTQRKKLN